jgi:hypothetical protein
MSRQNKKLLAADSAGGVSESQPQEEHDWLEWLKRARSDTMGRGYDKSHAPWVRKLLSRMLSEGACGGIAHPKI